MKKSVILKNSKKNTLYFHPCLKSFQMKQEFFKSGHINSWSLQKRCFARKKVSYWKKSAILQNSKTSFMDLRFRNWTYIQTSFWLKNRHATSSSQARCVFRIFVNQISISCRNNNEQIRYLFLSICSLSKFFHLVIIVMTWWKSDSQKYGKRIEITWLEDF